MSDVFEDAMRGQFDAGQHRFADDEFADDFGKAIVGRVKRRRMVTTTAIGGGTVVAVGAIAVAALNLPLGSATPASSPGCVTWSPSPAPYPVATISPDPTDFSYDVTLPDGDGVMTLARSNGVQEGFDVTLPDGTTFKAPADDASGASVFKLPNLPLVVVAKEDFSGNLTVSVGGADAVVIPTYGGLPPRVVSDATPSPNRRLRHHHGRHRNRISVCLRIPRGPEVPRRRRTHHHRRRVQDGSGSGCHGG